MMSSTVLVVLPNTGSTNKHRRFYQRGATYDITQKYEVFHCYLKRKHRDHVEHPNISEIARESKVLCAYVRMIEREYLETGGSLINLARGPGAKTLDKLDMVVLMFSYFDVPTQCNGSYVEHLFAYTGTVVSESVVSCFFNHGFPISGRFRC